MNYLSHLIQLQIICNKVANRPSYANACNFAEKSP
jgi:hypothetical protein